MVRVSIYASWPDVGEDESDRPNGEVLTYRGSHVYPDPTTQKPGTCAIAHIPGFIGPHGDREQFEDWPYAPYLRLDIGSWDEQEGGPMIVDGATCVLTAAAVERLRDQLSQWLARPRRAD